MTSTCFRNLCLSAPRHLLQFRDRRGLLRSLLAALKHDAGLWSPEVLHQDHSSIAVIAITLS